MRVTIKDIAKIAGVSHTTVSRALNGNPRISKETIERIQQIANELGYVPNVAAQGLKTSSSRILGVIARRIDDPFFSEVIQGIEDVLYEGEYSLFLAASHRDPVREKEIVQAMAERRVDGVIISSTQVLPQHIQQFEKFNVPLVLINNQSVDNPDAHAVYHDDVDGSYQIVRHLIQLGHTQMAFLGNERGGKANRDRIQGYQNALMEAGLSFDPNLVIVTSNGRPHGGAEGMRLLLEREQLPTAVVCYNDMSAIGALQVAHEYGVNIPNDMSITGFDDIELSAYVSPSLTTFHQPKYELGQQAAKMMLRMLASREKTGVIPQADMVRLSGEVIVRRSTAPPRMAN